MAMEGPCLSSAISVSNVTASSRRCMAGWATDFMKASQGLAQSAGWAKTRVGFSARPAHEKSRIAAMRHQAFEGEVTPDILVDRYRRARSRTRELAEPIAEEAYYDRPIRTRNPIVFSQGPLPAFAVHTRTRLAV